MKRNWKIEIQFVRGPMIQFLKFHEVAPGHLVYQMEFGYRCEYIHGHICFIYHNF